LTNRRTDEQIDFVTGGYFQINLHLSVNCDAEFIIIVTHVRGIRTASSVVAGTVRKIREQIAFVHRNHHESERKTQLLLLLYSKGKQQFYDHIQNGSEKAPSDFSPVLLLRQVVCLSVYVRPSVGLSVLCKKVLYCGRVLLR